jgi:hypothetical protein
MYKIVAHVRLYVSILVEFFQRRGEEVKYKNLA